MAATRQDYKNNLARVVKGIKLSSYSLDTINEVNLCAQQVRQAVEDTEKIAPGTWDIAGIALVVARDNGRKVRWAVDYEEAAKRMNRAYPQGTKPQSGDIGYWAYAQWGHTAIFYDYIDGVGYWIENTNAVSRRGGRVLLRDKNGEGHIWLTPETTLGKPRTLVKPNATIDEPVKTVAPKKKVDNSEDAGTPVKFSRLYKVEGDNAVFMGNVVKATIVGDKEYVVFAKE